MYASQSSMRASNINTMKHEQTCVTYEKLNITFIHSYINMELKLLCLLLYRRTATDPNILFKIHEIQLYYSCHRIKIGLSNVNTVI